MKGRLSRRGKRLALLVLLAAYAAFAATGCGADRLVLGENHQTLDPDGARRHALKVDGRDVEYWVTRSPGARDREPAAFVLYFTGKGSLAQRWIGPVAEAWGERPVEMWAMNYPGSGGSEGPASLARVGPSALAVYDALRDAAGGRPVFVEGGSFGTTAALRVAAQRPVAGLILKNPPALRELIMGSYGWWNLWLAAWPISRAIPDDLDSLANAAKATAPALFLSAGADAKVPARYHERVFAAYAGPKEIIRLPGAGHDDPLTRVASQQFESGVDRLWRLAGLPAVSQEKPLPGGVPSTLPATPTK
jgi:pimeloyl-ACP methyl ester carboxylesterase